MATDSRELRFYSQDVVLLASPEPNNRIFNRLGIETKTNGKKAKSREVTTKTDVCEFDLTEEEQELFDLLREVVIETKLKSTLRVAGGWVRDKLLGTSEYQRGRKETKYGTIRLTSKFHKAIPHTGYNTGFDENEHHPVDIDIALDNMLGREFADHLNEFLSEHGKETISVGVVLKNPEKSKHLETATMKVGSFWIDFVNLRAEEYTHDSRIPDLMRIGTAAEDSYRRDLTINSLFYNINSDKVEDFTGRGLEDLKRGVISTPLSPLTTLLDDPLRVLRSIRFAARLRFTMDDSLKSAAMNSTVREALDQKVSRERIGGEVDLMLRSPDPVGAMRLLINLNLAQTVFPIHRVLPKQYPGGIFIFTNGLNMLDSTFDYLCENIVNRPVWCDSEIENGERTLVCDDEARRLLWYAAYFSPLSDYASLLDETKANPKRGKKQNRSVISKLLVDHLKQPSRDAENVEKIINAAADFSRLIQNGFDLSAQSILLSGIKIKETKLDGGKIRTICKMGGKNVTSKVAKDPIWDHAMEFRLLTSKVLERIGPLWRAALVLSLVQSLVTLKDDFEYTIEGDVFEESQDEIRQGLIQQYDTFAVALQKIGLIGIWDRKPIMDGREVKKVLPKIPKGPIFREIMDEQDSWMTVNPGGSKDALILHLQKVFSSFM
eukprot:CAMPEP_0194209746 /NCGR_PEP_ID=MMETSP0156-20130528/7760_1 /TAXON_ID=33649 /ORGANISM="Thalassionema nitzschioides, Strain L26-B" /LENGTH=662 /DNA_ID=CAMNT_0038936961 /DNA_START=341 /DNA_END=2329 /DNA_ORIENTATION=+